MSKNITTINEVIDMACKGYLPVKMLFVFQEEVYDFQKISRDRTSLLYFNEDESSYIDFRLDKDGRLEYVEFNNYDPDDLEDHILFDIRWTPELIKKTYYNYGIL